MKLQLDFQPKLFTKLRGYNRQTFVSDLIAGLIVGIVALPLAIAFGIASGVSPVQGLITAIIGGFIVSLLGGSSVQIGGPTGAFIVIVAGVIAEFGLGGLMIATIMAGIILVLMGVFKLGVVIKFIPYPIVVGFTGGIALTIFTTQIKDLTGMSIESVPADFLSKWACYFQNLGSIDPWALGIGLVSIVIIALTPMISHKIPGSLVAIVLMTVVTICLEKWAGVSVETIGQRFPEITSGFSFADLKPTGIDINFSQLSPLISVAFTIAILGAIESLLSATVADGVTGGHHNANTELIGQGVANILVPFFGGIPVTGAIARTMTNINNGGKTPVAGLIHAVVLLLILLFLTPLIVHIPMACLAGVLVVVSYNMSGWRTIRSLMRAPKSDIAVLFTTMILTVVFDLTIAIEIGLLLAVILFMKRLMETTKISVVTEEIDLAKGTDNSHHERLNVAEGVEVYEIDGPYFFGVATKFDEVMRNLEPQPKARIIRMRRVPFIDSTGLHNLEILVESSHKRGIEVILSGVGSGVRTTLEHAKFDKLVGKENICSNIQMAVERANAIVGKA
ncbi:MAG: sulfate permease [Rikenellaceae bacterium]|nr:sulfate permease [Rikenellaceae bacterium]